MNAKATVQFDWQDTIRRSGKAGLLTSPRIMKLWHPPFSLPLGTFYRCLRVCDTTDRPISPVRSTASHPALPKPLDHAVSDNVRDGSHIVDLELGHIRYWQIGLPTGERSRDCPSFSLFTLTLIKVVPSIVSKLWLAPRLQWGLRSVLRYTETAHLRAT